MLGFLIEQVLYIHFLDSLNINESIFCQNVKSPNIYFYIKDILDLISDIKSIKCFV